MLLDMFTEFRESFQLESIPLMFLRKLMLEYFKRIKMKSGTFF